MSATPQTKPYPVSQVLKIPHIVVSLHSMGVCECVWVWLYVCAFECGCVSTYSVHSVYSRVYVTYTCYAGKMEKALSFSQRIIGLQSRYEWLTHVR